MLYKHLVRRRYKHMGIRYSSRPGYTKPMDWPCLFFYIFLQTMDPNQNTSSTPNILTTPNTRSDPYAHLGQMQMLTFEIQQQRLFTNLPYHQTTINNKYHNIQLIIIPRFSKATFSTISILLLNLNTFKHNHLKSNFLNPNL